MHSFERRLWNLILKQYTLNCNRERNELWRTNCKKENTERPSQGFQWLCTSESKTFFSVLNLPYNAHPFRIYFTCRKNPVNLNFWKTLRISVFFILIHEVIRNGIQVFDKLTIRFLWNVVPHDVNTFSKTPIKFELNFYIYADLLEI